MKTPPPPLRVVSFAVPTLGLHEAETIIDLLEQIQGALWDIYGDAISEHALDGERSADDSPSWSSPNDDPAF